MNILRPLPRGRAATDDAVFAASHELIQVMESIRSEMGFSPTLRGWCYLLEGRSYITKGQFDQLEVRITMARKRGWLDLAITAEDGTRAIRGLPNSTDDDPRRHLELYVNAAVGRFMPRGPDEFRAAHVEIQVEKLDLVELFTPAARDYGVGITCSRGWNDLHSRAAMLQRFEAADSDDKECVLLAFGDFDPGGLAITKHLEANLDEVAPAAGVTLPPYIEIVRVGLNYEDIERLGLTWIDGLETSSGQNLADPRHPQHRNADVQEYLRRYGARKCEANALIVQPDEADRIIREALSAYISDSEVHAWREAQSES